MKKEIKESIFELWFLLILKKGKKRKREK